MRWLKFFVTTTCIVWPLSLWAADAAPRSITTSGESLVYVAPDEIVVNLGVETRDAKLDKAKAANDAAAERLVKAIKQLGIEDRHIQTDHMEISLLYPDGQRLTVDGYQAHRSYSVTLKDTKKFETLLETALNNGANQLSGFDYRTTELRKHRDKARSMAIRAAKEKAAALAGELDCKLGRPRTINEGSVWSGYYGGWGYGRGGGMMMQNTVQTAPAAGDGGEESGTMRLGQIAVRANVSVTFDLTTAE